MILQLLLVVVVAVAVATAAVVVVVVVVVVALSVFHTSVNWWVFSMESKCQQVFLGLQDSSNNPSRFLVALLSGWSQFCL